MAKPSRIGPAFLILFALPFIGMGMAAIFAFTSSAKSTPNAIASATFAGGFAAIGVMLAGAAIYGFHQQQQLAKREELHPDSPWLWREDWARGLAEGEHRNRALGLWI